MNKPLYTNPSSLFKITPLEYFHAMEADKTVGTFELQCELLQSTTTERWLSPLIT